MKKMRLFCGVCISFITLFLLSQSVLASDYVPLISPSVILVEQSSGKVLYGKNERDRMYPASMTKVLTALVAIEYLNPDDVVVVGNEIYGLPPDYNTAVHLDGESITVRNLLRALMIRSGNETGCILALNTIRAIEERQDIPYEEAERRFCIMMNEKARSLGAMDSNFVNPYGLHSENHYTTAYDLALICRAYMDNPILRGLAGEREYIGGSLEGQTVEGAVTQEYNWVNHNELLLAGSNGYPYATGIKTGFHDDAGDCLAASAAKNGIELVAIIFFSEDPGRYQDARMLFDYGFETYDYETIQTKDEELEVAAVANPRLGDSGELTVLADDEVTSFLSEAEMERLERRIAYDQEYIDAEAANALSPPIEQNAVLGKVLYTLDGELLFEGTVRAAAPVLARNFDSDMDYYIAQFKENIFSLKSLPFWFGGIGLLIGIIGIIIAVSGRRKNSRRDRWRGGGYNGGYGRSNRYR